MKPDKKPNGFFPTGKNPGKNDEIIAPYNQETIRRGLMLTYKDGYSKGYEQGKLSAKTEMTAKELVELLESELRYGYSSVKGVGYESYPIPKNQFLRRRKEAQMKLIKWLKSQLSKKHVLSEVSSQESSKEGEKR